MSTINERFAILVDSIGRVADMAKLLDMSHQAVSGIYKGRNKPSFDIIQGLAKNIPKLNLEWLLLGKGEMYHNKPDIVSYSKHPDTLQKENEQLKKDNERYSKIVAELVLEVSKLRDDVNELKKKTI